ncbi:unnamed protein product, partial [Didymodactylos carnosus]
MKTFFSDLDVLEKILELVYDRPKVVTGIFRATHDEALCAVLRWSGLVEHSSRKIWYTHVYRMGIIMLNLIDRRQVTNAICIQFIQALQQRIVDNEESDEDAESINPMMDPFFVAMASRLAIYIDILKTLTHDLHRQLASFFLVSLSRPRKYENGQLSFEYVETMHLWFKIAPCLTMETDTRLYEPYLKQMHAVACDDAAINYVEVFLADIIDRKQTDIIGLRHSSLSKQNATVDFAALIDDFQLEM